MQKSLRVLFILKRGSIIMGVSFVYGPACSGKSTDLYHKILSEAEKNIKKKYIFVVPEQFALSVEKELIDLSSGHGIINIEVLSFTRLAYRIMESASDKMKPVLNDIGKTMLLRNIMQTKKSELKLFAGKERKIGFLDEIKSIVSEFSQYRVTPEMLEKNIAGCDGDKPFEKKLHDLKIIYEEFINKVSALNYTTAETMAELCFKHIGTCGLLKGASLIFDGFTGFTPIQYEFIERILTSGADLAFIITADKQVFRPLKAEKFLFEIDKSNELFDMSTEMSEKLLEISVRNGYIPQMPEYIEHECNVKAIDHLKKNIFRFDAKQQTSDDSITIASLKNKKLEIIYAAARISEMVRDKEKKYRYSDFALVCGDLESYAAYASDIFEKYNIPCHVDYSNNISSNPLIDLIRNAFDTIDNNFRPDSVVAFMKSPVFERGTEIYEFENYILSKNFRGESAFSRVWKDNYRGNYKLDIDKINELRKEMLSYIRLLRTKNEATAEDISDGIKALLEKINAEERLKQLAEKISAGDIKDAARLKREYTKVYDAVLNLLDQIVELMGDEIISISQFKNIFMAGAEKTKLGMIPKKNDVVIIGDIKRTRLGYTRVLFLLGVNDGVIPPVVNSSGVLTGEDRKHLSLGGIDLAVQPFEKPAREEYYIYLALAKPKDRLFVTFSRSAEKATEREGDLKPSYVIDLIRKCFVDLPINIYVPDEISDIICSYADLTGEKLKSAVEFAERNPNPDLSKKLLDQLYKNGFTASVSTIEKYGKCPFAGYASNILKLEKRPVNEPQSFDYGLLFHDALKRYMSSLKELKSCKDDPAAFWKKAEGSEYKEVAIKSLHDAVENYEAIDYLSDKRLENFVERMEKVMLMVTDSIHSQLRCGSYQPAEFEYNFSTKSDKEEEKINVTGIIDRIDIAESDGKKLLKVVDYKTGSKELNLTELFYGVQLQLPLYLSQLLKDEKYKNMVPALALYQKVELEKVEDSDKEDANLKRKKDLKPDGLINKSLDYLESVDKKLSFDGKKYNPDVESEALKIITTKSGTISPKYSSNGLFDENDMKLLYNFAENKLKEISGDILNGKINIKPFMSGKKTACDYCDFKGFCGFDVKQKYYNECYNRFEKKEIEDFKNDEN